MFHTIIKKNKHVFITMFHIPYILEIIPHLLSLVQIHTILFVVRLSEGHCGLPVAGEQSGEAKMIGRVHNLCTNTSYIHRALYVTLNIKIFIFCSHNFGHSFVMLCMFNDAWEKNYALNLLSV